MDEVSDTLVIDLQQEDISNAFENQKGKQLSGRLTDFELALHTYKNELDGYAAILQDRIFAKSISKAIQDDGVALGTAAQEEAEAFDDRAIALRLGGHERSSPDHHQGRPTRTNFTEETLTNLAQLSISEEPPYTGTAINDTEAESSKSTTNPRRDCTACMDSNLVSGMIEAPCSHYYCQTCAISLFEDSITDESLFPPRCCRQTIPLSVARGFLGVKLVDRFEEKTIERNDHNRTYCANPACSLYILPGMVELDVGTCTSCLGRTCTLCKKVAHSGDCKDEEQEVLEIARAEGWQRCFQCHNMVELIFGCNHITCRCGAQFCYVCGVHWKTCGCERWNENRLFDRAHQVVARDRQVEQGPPPEQEIRQLMQNLRRDHECDHAGRWRRVDGSHRCEECQYRLPDYILECRQCRLRACVRCRRNRL